MPALAQRRCEDDPLREPYDRQLLRSGLTDEEWHSKKISYVVKMILRRARHRLLHGPRSRVEGLLADFDPCFELELDAGDGT